LIESKASRNKKPAVIAAGYVLAGGDEGIRTLGLCVANASLSHLSYIPTQKNILNHPLRISTVIFSRDVTTEAPAAAP
jgi:hypothetical protein